MCVREFLTPDGDQIWVCRALPGISLEFYDVMHTAEEPSDPDDTSWSFRVDYCAEGRIEGAFTRGRFDSLSAGEFALNSSAFRMLKHIYPLQYYRGLSLVVTEEKLLSCDREALRRMGIDFAALNERFETESQWFKRPADGVFLRIFQDLGRLREEADPHYLRLKFMELMYWVNRLEKTKAEAAPYVGSDRVERLRGMVMRVLEQGGDEEALAEVLAGPGLNKTAFYRLFRVIYKDTPGRFFRNYRLDRAALRLKRTDWPIRDIAAEAGYQSASKFASVFKARFGKSPAVYREEGTAQGRAREKG